MIHCNEWHTALIPNWLKTVYQPQPFYQDIATLYTAHNLEYQGIFGYRVLEIAGLADMGFIAHPDVAPDLNYVVDLMARGILFADIINTVSETYAREILTPEYGQRLDPVLRDRRDRLFGILNGIDTELYDPATDQHIAAHFDAEQPGAARAEQGCAAGRAQAARPPRRAADRRRGPADRAEGLRPDRRIADPLLQNEPCQLVVMGTGEMRHHDLLNALAGALPGAGRGPADLQPAARAAHLCRQRHLPDAVAVRAVRAEPDGRHALRRGARRPRHGRPGRHRARLRSRTGEGNGFSFARYDAMALFAALIRAAETYRHQDIWRQLMRRCMAIDFSWQRSAENTSTCITGRWRPGAGRTSGLSDMHCGRVSDLRITLCAPNSSTTRDAYLREFDAQVLARQDDRRQARGRA